MKLFTKIFLLGMLVLGLAFSASGYLLLHYSLESSLARESEFALKQYQYDKFTVQSALLSATAVTVSINYGDILQPGGYQAYTIKEPYSEGIFRLEDYQEANLFGALAEELSVPAAFFGQNRSLLYSDIRDLDPSFLDSLTENAHVWQFFPSEKGGSILVGSILRRESILVGVTSDGGSLQPPASASDGNPALGQSVYFVTQWDISKTLAQQDTLRQYFLQCYLAAMAAGMVLLIILSAFLTGPLNKMSKAARRIAEGNYGDRLSLKSQDEIGELADSFNQMAGCPGGKGKGGFRGKLCPRIKDAPDLHHRLCGYHLPEGADPGRNPQGVLAYLERGHAPGSPFREAHGSGSAGQAGLSPHGAACGRTAAGRGGRACPASSWQKYQFLPAGGTGLRAGGLRSAEDPVK